MKYCSHLVLVFLFFSCKAQQQTVTYHESNEDLLNPERGFYIPSGTKASRFEQLDKATLIGYRNQERSVGRSSYKIRVSLIYRGYELDLFKHRALPDTFLAALQRDFDIVRESGLKLVLRFMYTNDARSGNCPDQYQICPPYGDAPRAMVLHHIRQLKPLLQKNADVIAVLQEGFIGIWGENYFTDYFGDASTNGTGKILDSSWLHRNELLAALLDAMPSTRMVQVRTPQIKQKFMYGPSADVSSRPLDSSMAYNGTAAARIGFHNDCFLASDDDYGTYFDNGSSTQPRGPANEPLRRFIEADTRYTAVGGETCDDAFSPQNDCAPAGYAEQEMRRMHYSYLNAAYNNSVNNDWDSSGCLYAIRRQLGYRMVLRSASFPTRVSAGKQFDVAMSLDNVGYAAPFNPRPVLLIFRDSLSRREYTSVMDVNPQTWYSGNHHIMTRVKLPAAVKAGVYRLYLWLPDADSRISKRPEYSLLFANTNMVEQRTGYMDLHVSLQVR